MTPSRRSPALAIAALALLAAAAACSNSAEKLLPDGAECGAGGDAACESGHCDAGVCCASGSCCLVAADCPGTFRSAAACTDTTGTTTCQGTRGDATCTGFVCGTATRDDDSGCAPYTRACGGYKDVTCTSAMDQPVATCATTCAGPSDCKTGYACVSNACVPIVGTGATCTGTGQGSCDAALKCENSVCCASGGPTCCSSAHPCASGLACDGTTFACGTSCTKDTGTGCADPANQVCTDGAHCVSKYAVGATCTADGQCGSGHCVDGVCCNATCSGQCEACNVAGSVGTCTAVTGQPVGTRTPCAGDGSVCGGTCNGSNRTACTYPPTTTVCRTAYCANAVATLPATCNGAGSCPALVTQSCGTYACGPNAACLTSCTTDAHCSAGNYCITTVAGFQNTCQIGAIGSPCDVPFAKPSPPSVGEDCDPNLTCTTTHVCKLIAGQACDSSSDQCGQDWPSYSPTMTQLVCKTSAACPQVGVTCCTD